ncbi:hypothetical protein HK100_008572 [Physocladia obscura]|uniref:Ribosomal protein S3 n=1 Tax=Physocladia obscura TaxID=109957 RepID=A0AAD5TAU0_9FUNG|nr:hypothetical protein HK100_008572 [Physocladia obscura]
MSVHGAESAFGRFVKELARISVRAPMVRVLRAHAQRAPRRYNTHLLTQTPFAEIEEARRARRSVEEFEVQRESKRYAASGRSPMQAAVFHKLLDRQLRGDALNLPDSYDSNDNATNGSYDIENNESNIDNATSIEHSAFFTDVPLPEVLRRQTVRPSPILATESSHAKIAGLRIEVNGKRGTRANRQVIHFGKLATNDSNNSMVDYAKAAFSNKKGATGVKVWIAYSR